LDSFVVQTVSGNCTEGTNKIANIWLEPGHNEKGDHFRVRYFIKIFNLGNGAAKDIRISWDYEIERLVETINHLAHESFRNILVKLERNALSIEGKELGGATFFLHNDLQGSIDYILPISAFNTPATAALPMTFVDLMSIYYDLCLGADAKKQGGAISYDDSLSRIKMTIEYKDIGGSSHSLTTFINVNVVIYKPRDDKEIFTALIEQDNAKTS